jgi:hypothetical protein
MFKCFFSQGCPKEDYNELVSASTSGIFFPTERDSDFRCGITRLKKAKPTFIAGGKSSGIQEFPFAVLLVKNIHFLGTIICLL